MVTNLTFSTGIFESLGILSSFKYTETIWDVYEKFASQRIKESTIKLRGSLYYLKYLTPEQAAKDLKSISPFMPVLSNLKLIIESNNDFEFQDFRSEALYFFDAVDNLYVNLQDIADINSSYKLSHPVLAADWDREEDEHWNNY